MDVRVTPGWLAPLVDFMESHPHAGAVNPLILLDHDSGRVNAAGQNVHITALGFNRLLGKPIHAIGRTPVEVSGIQGGAFLIRKRLLQELGGMEESGFLYHEDVDLSWMLLLKGYRLYCVPASTVYHDYCLTMSPEKLYLLERNRLAMLLTHLRLASLLLLSPWLAVSECLLWGYCLLKGARFLRAKALSYRWIISRRADLRLRRVRVQSQRAVGDRDVLRKLTWKYSLDQFVALGTERSGAQGGRRSSIPIELSW
jgi:GT2 family glycosyltransferase